MSAVSLFKVSVPHRCIARVGGGAISHSQNKLRKRKRSRLRIGKLVSLFVPTRIRLFSDSLGNGCIIHWCVNVLNKVGHDHNKEEGHMSYDFVFLFIILPFSCMPAMHCRTIPPISRRRKSNFCTAFGVPSAFSGALCIRAINKCGFCLLLCCGDNAFMFRFCLAGTVAPQGICVENPPVAPWTQVCQYVP